MVRSEIRMFLFCLCFSICLYASTQQTSPVLTINKHHHLKILNKYQDEITVDEREALPEPLVVAVEDSNFVLSDQVTRVLKVSFGKTTLFICRDGERGLNKLLADKSSYFGKKANYANETNEKVTMEATPGGKEEQMARDFGIIKENVLARISEVNLLYKEWFAHYNAKSGKSMSLPSWKVTSDNEFELHLKLSMPGYSDKPLKHSTQKLVADIESVLIGFQKFVVYKSFGEIVIKMEP